jgi:dynein light chain roadblock-type
MSEVDEAFNRIKTHKGVKGILIINADDISIRSTLTAQDSNKYAALLGSLTTKARSTLRELDSTNDLKFLRIRSKKHEIMIAPDREYTLIVIQNPDEE